MTRQKHSTTFRQNPLYRVRRPRGESLQYLKQRSSFWIAALSLLTFITGNMLGQHGLYAFWHAVIGGFDDSLITYTGTAPPIAFVPDYARWSQPDTPYRDVPTDVLIPLPPYTQKFSDPQTHAVYSIGHMGSYQTGEEGNGSHPGIDIRAPEGTPIRSIANGIVTQVRESDGFGKLIVIRHPHMPDPENPTATTVLHSVYAHLREQFVTEGEVVRKGQEIGLSGSTGIVTGPHLHFQIDRDNIEWHPYWPFTAADLRRTGWTLTEAINKGLNQEQGYAHTVNPMIFVQANFPPVTVVAVGKETPAPAVLPETETLSRARSLATMTARREKRTERRIARQRFVERQLTAAAGTPDIALQQEIKLPAPNEQHVNGVAIEHDGFFREGLWETITLELQDAQGQTITQPLSPLHIQIQTGYGDADFQPATLSELDFQDGKAIVKFLPKGTRTIVVRILPFESISQPLRHGEK
ncbi:M23 family metallopeptidase [Candidatus Peregrinibacteria bacterium]|nr:M23 family metallopeptidase [Candidatus Peregrinibacteria bacterium]